MYLIILHYLVLHCFTKNHKPLHYIYIYIYIYIITGNYG